MGNEKKVYWIPRKIIIALVVLLLLMPAFSVLAKDLGNSDIIEMLGAKLPEKTIITIIESSTVNVDTSAEAIAKLRAAGSSDALIAVIFKVAFKPQTAPISQPVADSKKDNFLSDARILLIQDGKNIDLVAESLTIRNAISSLFTFTPKRYADFRPLNASMRVDSPSPIFEQSMEAQHAPQNNIFLLKLEKSTDLHSAKRVAAIVYDQGGNPAFPLDEVIPLEFQQIQDASRAEATRKSWRFKPKQPLEPGEYAIAYRNMFYTFGVDGAPESGK